jgi:hypothetical protein
LFDKSTFDSAANWKKDIDTKVFLANGDRIPVILLGNKVWVFCFSLLSSHPLVS